jgi:hypothetical protein
MSDVLALLAHPGTEATVVPGRPARSGHLALWHPTVVPASFTHTLDLVLPAGASVRQRSVPATFVPVDHAIDLLLQLDPERPGTLSLRRWAAVTEGALALLAEGRLLPAIDDDGVDTWRIGPLDHHHLIRRDVLADALPPAAHATVLAGSAPRRIASPRWLAARWWDAVADAYVRTAAAPVAAGHDAYAARERIVLIPPPTTDPTNPAQAAGARALGIDLATATWGTDATTATWLTPTTDTDAEAFRVALRLEVAEGKANEFDTADLRAVLEVASAADPSLVLDAADLWDADPAVADRFGAHPLDALLLALRRGARVWDPLGRLLDERRPASVDLAPEEVEDLLGPAATSLEDAGVEVRWPAGMLAPVELRAVVATAGVDADRPGALGLEALGELRWDAVLDGERLEPHELAALVEAKRSVVRLRGRWVRADPTRLARLEHRRTLTAGAAIAAALTGEVVVEGDEVAAEIEGPLADLGHRLRTLHDRPSEWQAPGGLRAELRPYQRTGVTWLVEMADLGVGGVLADDMGLGKTVQFLALHLARHDGPTLVVCPVSVLSNWAREAARFAPDVPVIRFHGAQRSLDDLPERALVLTTYGVARRETAVLAEHRWGLVAADEAQAIKNPRSRTARALRSIPASARFALTGTPVENRLVDLWALLDWTTPGLLGPLDRFRREVAVPIERHRDADAADELATLVRPFLLRRRKIDPDIVPDLPPKTETDRVVPLTREQATLYQAVVDEVMDQVEHAEGMARRGLVLKLLTALKQVCDHPALYLRQAGPLAGRSGKLDAVGELVETIHDEAEAVLIFTQYVTMGHLLVQHLEQPGRRVRFLHGGTSAARRQELVDDFQAGGFPVFVISVKAGGTGLNLTRATHVIHFDRWWNPAVEDQASDRAWRIGQEHPVQVHRMVCEGTVEDRIATMLTDKRALAEAVVSSGEGWISELGDAELRHLVELGADDDGGQR